MMYLGIVAFLMMLAVFDLVVGVSNDAVNFLNSAIGAKVARFRTIVLIAAIGVFAGATMSNGMMDVARHGIMTPTYFSFYDVMCVFLAVMVTDVILLDIFNTLGMPTSTTVSMVFELLGGAFAIALIKIIGGDTDMSGIPLTLGDLLNTEKALSVILGIFLSVAIAFVLGTVVQWLARLIFTFTYRVNGKTTDASGRMGGLASSSLKIGIFGGIAVTCIIWFLLINGLKNSTFMTPEVQLFISQHTWQIIGGGFLGFSLLMTLLSAFKLPVLKFIVLLGTFALAMAFAGNDLVNFVGVPLAGLDSYNDYMANGQGEDRSFLMQSLLGSAQTPAIYLMLAGMVMVLSLIFSKKAQNVVKTSVDLSRQDEGDEMFGSSVAARLLVRSASKTASALTHLVPPQVGRWIDSRFNSDAALLPAGAAFDHIRASVNLVLAGLLVALGTSLKLPLSTTYVTFMVAMGSSLADRAWNRESAVFRITGVISVIGGWFITAGAAFVVCFVLTIGMFFGQFLAMLLFIAIAVYLLVRSHRRFVAPQPVSQDDLLFSQLMREQDMTKRFQLLRQHVRLCCGEQLKAIMGIYETVTEAFFREEYKPLRKVRGDIDEQRRQLKRQRRRGIISLRRIDPIVAVEHNTWFFLSSNAVSQMLYCLKRIDDPCREHVGNHFTPVNEAYIHNFIEIRNHILMLFSQAQEMIETDAVSDLETIRLEASKLQLALSAYRKSIMDDMQQHPLNIEAMTVFLNLIQESQEMLGALRHMIRGLSRFEQ